MGRHEEEEQPVTSLCNIDLLSNLGTVPIYILCPFCEQTECISLYVMVMAVADVGAQMHTPGQNINMRCSCSAGE